MTKKHYEAIAAEFAGLKGDNTEGEEAMRVFLARRMARLFRNDNPRFDANRFLRACRLEEKDLLPEE